MSTAEQIAESRSTSSSFKSVPDMWHHRIHSTPGGDAMTYRDAENRWTTMSWREAGERSRAISSGLLALGIEREQRCCILATTSVEWILADMAILCAGGATTTIYPSSTPEECEYIINDCGAAYIFVDTDAQLQKLLAVREQLSHINKVVVMSGKGIKDDWVITLAALEKLGRDHEAANPNHYDEVSGSVSPGDMATLIYTSGTTGKPKGVILTHDAWVFESEAVDSMGIISPADKQFLFLPLSHVLAKVVQIVFIRLGVPTVVDGNIDTLVANLGETSPTWMCAVPRIFEKAYNRIVQNAKDGGGVKYALFRWALEVGQEVSQVRQQRKEPGGMLALKYAIADRLVFSKVKQTFGGKLRFFISGGAPLAPEIAQFFHACDILILEGYGLTESGAASCVNTPDDFIFGTVGRPVEGCEVKIADDGEILLHSRGNMKGYYNRPEATQESLSADGWLHTGDLGTVLDSGHVKITGRKKDLIITAGGKNISPAHFQNMLKGRSSYVSQVLMHGDRRSFCVALLTVDEDAITKWAKDKGISFTDYADLTQRKEVHDLLWADVEAINAELPSYETVKKLVICNEDWTIENGMLTPSMKVKRRVVEKAYENVLDAFYTGSMQTVD